VCGPGSAAAADLWCMLAPCCCSQNKMKINDWSAIQTLFDELEQAPGQGPQGCGQREVPRVYIRMIVELEGFLTGVCWVWGSLQGGRGGEGWHMGRAGVAAAW